MIPSLRDLSDDSDRCALLKHCDDLVIVAGTCSEVAGSADHSLVLRCPVVREFVIIARAIVRVSVLFLVFFLCLFRSCRSLLGLFSSRSILLLRLLRRRSGGLSSRFGVFRIGLRGSRGFRGSLFVGISLLGRFRDFIDQSLHVILS